MNIHFSLRKQGDTDPVIILQVFDARFKARKFMFSTGYNIDPKTVTWNVDKGRAKIKGASTRVIELSQLNDYLDKLEQTVKDYLNIRLNSKSLSREDLKKHILNSKKDERKDQEEKFQKENDFFKIWQNIIDTTKNQKTGRKITSGTIRSKQQTKNLVSAFCIDKKLNLTFEGIDMVFYHQFDAYLDGKGFESKGLSGNSKGKHFKEIKAILREAQDRDIPVNTSFTKKSFKVIREESDSVYLNEDELKKLLNLKLTPAKEALRDIFVMASFVGCRHSDWSQIHKNNIVTQKGKELLKITQKKTRSSIHVPVHSVVRMILNKYKDSPPRVISNQKFNAALKDICKAKDLELGKVSIGGKMVDKYDYISTHTARRSFATNAYLSKSMSVYSIMSCTGHKTESSFLKYLKLSGLDKAQDLAESSWFNDQSFTMVKAS